MKKVLELADDYLWDIRWNFTKFCIRVDDIFSLFGKYPGYAIESTTKGNLPVMLWEEIDTYMVITSQTAENMDIGKEYFIIPEEDGQWYPEHPSEYSCSENRKI